MTIAELEALAALYFPSKVTPAGRNTAEKGRASVTLHLVEGNTLRLCRSDEEVTMPWFIKEKAICPTCRKEFPLAYGVKKIYCSNACRQRAYRHRKKAAA